jgi:hypothetical protein
MINFPLATWQVNRPSFTVTTNTGSGTPSAALVYGFGVSNVNAGTAASDSLAGDFKTALLGTSATTGITIATAVYEYQQGTAPASGFLRCKYSINKTATISFGNANNMKIMGFEPTVGFILSVTANTFFYSQYNVDGFWAPCGVAGDIRRIIKQRAAASSSEMSGAATDVVNWGQVADLDFMSTAFPAGNLTRWFAATQVYADAAGRNVNDPNNTLEGLLAAAATGANFRIYREATNAIASAGGSNLPTSAQPAKMVSIANKSAAGDFCQAIDEPRLWQTSSLIFRAS